MGTQFRFGFSCEHTGRRMEIGCDSRITMKTKGPVTWKALCICGLPVEVTKWGDKCVIKHKKPPENVASLHKKRTEIIVFPEPKDPIYKDVAKELKKDTDGKA